MDPDQLNNPVELEFLSGDLQTADRFTELYGLMLNIARQQMTGQRQRRCNEFFLPRHAFC